MKKLTREAQERARAFLYTQARPLERAFYAYEFEAGSRIAVFRELAAFQNPDGGFGHGMEPDLQLADSSALATTVGLQHLRALGASSEDPLVRGAMAYLLRTYDAERQVWPIIPPNTDDAPHAPWWTFTDDVAEKWGGFLANPRAEIVGYLWDYAELVPDGLRERLTKAVVEHLAAFSKIADINELLSCYLRLAETRSLPESIRAELWSTLVPAADRAVVKDTERWTTYCLTPLRLVESPGSPLMAVMSDAVLRNLDFAVDHQEADGCWLPEWSWYGLYPDAWPIAKLDWQGVLTLRMLRILRAFGRLA